MELSIISKPVPILPLSRCTYRAVFAFDDDHDHVLGIREGRDIKMKKKGQLLIIINTIWKLVNKPIVIA